VTNDTVPAYTAREMEPRESRDPEPQSTPPPSPSDAPSTEAGASIAADTGAASEPRENWLSAALRPFRRGGGERAAERDAADEQEKSEQSDAQPWNPPTFATKAEFDAFIERQNRSYADRRDSDRARRSAQQQADQLAATVAKLEGEKAQALADGDTWTVGEIEQKIARAKAGPGGEDSLDVVVNELRAQAAGETVARYDTILDRLVERLPERERSAVFPSDDEAQTMDLWAQRAHVADRAIDALIAQADQRARAKLRQDPVFQKEMLARLRGDTVADDEPVLVSAAPVGAGPTTMNEFLRSVRTHRR
jgi:hypothetical protein